MKEDKISVASDKNRAVCARLKAQNPRNVRIIQEKCKARASIRLNNLNEFSSHNTSLRLNFALSIQHSLFCSIFVLFVMK